MNGRHKWNQHKKVTQSKYMAMVATTATVIGDQRLLGSDGPTPESIGDVDHIGANSVDSNSPG